MASPRDIPGWLRTILNLAALVGVGATLMGWIHKDFGIIILVLCPLYFLWEVSPWITAQRRRRPVLSLVGFILAGGGLGVGAWWGWNVLVHPHDAVVNSPLPTSNGADTELAEVNNFICKRDEGALREEFDFPQMLTFNIDFAKQKLAPELVSPDQAAAIGSYFLNGQARIDMRYAHLTTVNNRVNVEWIPGKIGVINTSQKYNESRRKLTAMMSSAALPADVTAALKLLDDSIEKDSALMIESLNQSLAADPRNILQNSVYGSDWYGSASGLYWRQFIPLRPSADVVTLAVRKAMEAKNQSQAAN